MTEPTPPRRLRRRWKALWTAIALALGLIAALPWLLAAGPGRSRVAAGLNRAIAPGRLQFDALRLSWFGPTRLSGVILFDPKGVVVAQVPSAVLDRSFGQLLLGGSGPSSLTLEGASLDVERAQDGTINLADALRTIIADPDPRRDITIRIEGGSLRYRDPFLAEPATADPLDLTLRVPAAPNPITWTARLSRGDSRLEVQGDFDRWLSRGGTPKAPELQVGVVAKRWPFVARTAGLDATGNFDGSLDFARKRGRWVLSGDARLIGLQARGKALSGDTLAFDRLEAGWDLAEEEEGWSIRRLKLTSPVGDLKAEGQLTGGEGPGRQKIEGRIDLAALARQLPHALRLREGLAVDGGSARLSVDVETTAGQATYNVEAQVSDLAARDRDRTLTLRDPATFSARLVRKGDDSSVERFSVKTSFLDASARGRVADGVTLAGTLDLEGLRRQLGDWFDLGPLVLAGRAEISGTYRFRPTGSPMNGDELAGSTFEGPLNRPDAVIKSPRFENRLEIAFRDLRIEGVGPAPIRLDSARLASRVIGPSDDSGRPRAWERVDVSAHSNRWDGSIGLESRRGPIGMSAVAWMPLAEGDRDRTASARLSGEWSADGRTLTIEAASLALHRTTAGRSKTGIAASAKGRLDLSTGVLILAPDPKRPTDAIALDPDGIRVSGIGKGLGSLRADGGFSVDGNSLDHLLADVADRPPLGLSGRWSAVANAQGDGDGVQLAGKIRLDEVSDATPKPDRPTSLALRARYSTGGDRLDLSEFTVSTAYGTLDASGSLADLAGRRRLDLKGTLAPDFGAINAVLASKVEPGAKIDGKPRAFRAVGPLGDDPAGWKGLDAEVGFDLAGADFYGMKFGPSPVVLRARGGKLSVDPISTTLNEGHVRLESEIDLDAPGGPTLRMGKNSTIREARINDEVSRRVLAYVAPILDRATRVGGLVSVDLDHAEFPIGPGQGRKAQVEGAVVFEDVEFAPGPLANDILGALGRGDARLRLDRPVNLTIADGRVNQRGLSVPIGDLTRVELAGWVDFDRNLSLTATLPVTPAMLGNNPLLSDIAAGTQVRLPIGGTLDHPQVDREALRANLQDLGKSLLTRGATRGALELLMRLSRPRDPDAPPPPPRPSPEERKAQRQEKRAIRRGEIPPPPPEVPDR